MDGNNRSTALLVVVVVLLIKCRFCLAGFAEVPSSVTINVSENQNVLFRCRHERPDAIISWFINGTLSTRYSDVSAGSISESDGTFVDTLTIPAIPVYNGTEVVCLATFFDGSTSETTPPVMLTITGPPTTEPMTVAPTTTQPTTTESMTTTIQPTSNPGDFLTVPSPPVLIVTMEERHVYMCNHSDTINIFWRVNGSRLNVEIFPAEINPVTLVLPDGGRVYTLEIGGRLEHNATTIQCSARLSDGSTMTTPSVLFLMQGPLQSVANLKRRNDTIVWDAPFSLNLTNVEPDIVYSVEVYNITCGGRELLISDCNVTETSYTSDVIAPDGYIYEYIVTPRSNVEGAINGTSKTITEQFMNLTVLTRSESLSNIEKGDVMIQLSLEAQLQMNTVNPVDVASYSLSLYPLDGIEEESLLMSTIAMKNGSTVMLKVSLPYRRLWNYTVLAYDCEERPLIEINELSTHDIQNISVTSPQLGEVRVTGDFIDGSTATGLLIIIYSFTNDSDVHYIAKDSVPSLAGGEYSVSVFVVEENGLPFESVATLPKHVHVDVKKKQSRRSLMPDDVVTPPSFSIEYSLQSTSTGVCITCTFLDSSATDCVAVVHQRISQLNSSGLMNIKSYKLTRSNDTAFDCIEIVNMKDYQVGVVGGRRPPPLVTETKTNDRPSSIEGVIVGIVVLVFILLAVVVVVLLIVVRKRKRIKLLSLIVDIETRFPPIPPSSDDVNQLGNEATVNNHYESITVTNHQGSGTELDESADEALEPLLSTPSPPLPMRQGENRVYSDSSSDSATSSQDTIETDHSSPSETNDDRILVDPGPLYDLPQLPGSTDVQPPLDQCNEEESPPPVPLWTEDSEVLVEQSSNPSQSAQDNTSTNIQSPPDPTYAEPQLPGRAPVQTPPNEEQVFQSPPPLPPITQDREVLLQESSKSSPNQGSPHIAVSIDQPPCPDPTYAEPDNQPQSKKKQQVSRIPSGESGGPTYAQPVLFSPSAVTSLPPATEPVVYEDVKGFKNSKGQHYAMLGDLNTSKKVCTPDDSDQEKTVYSKIQPRSLVPTTAAVSVEPDTSSQKNKPTTERDPPFTGEHIFPRLLSLASKWLALGEALSLDEDLLDEIFTNNETDEACLHVMLEHYMERSDLKHSWEEVREAMRKVEEKDGETKGIDSSSLESLGKKPLDADSNAVNDGRVTSEHGPPPAVSPRAPPHTPTGVESASHKYMTTADSTTEECPAPKHVQPHMTCGQPHNDSSDALVDLVEVDTELKENECREHQQVQNNEGKEEEAAEEESGDNKNTVINIEDLRGTAEIQVSPTHTPPSDFSPQPFDDNKDECKEHQFPLSFQETQHDEADYKTELMKTLLKENKICQENLSRLNLGQSKTHEAERDLSLLESSSPSMVDSQNTKCYSIFYQYGGIVKKISVHLQVTIIEVCNPSQISCICVYVIFSQ